jgi:hypothetical protein
MGLLHRVQNCPEKNVTLHCFCTGVSILGTENEIAFSMPRLLWRIAKTGSSDTLHSQAIIDTLKCPFYKARCLTSGTLLKQSLLLVFQCGGHLSGFSMPVEPFTNMQFHHMQPASIHDYSLVQSFFVRNLMMNQCSNLKKSMFTCK